MGQVKIPRYSHRLMHRKRVTCELHDSYFRLMTIKHAIPKIAWAIELLYNSVKTGSQLVSRPDPLVTRCGRESHHPAEGALGTPDWVWRPVGEKMLEWEHVPERLGSQVPGWAAQENQNDTRRCLELLGRSICCSLCSVPNSLSHATFPIKWEVYSFKEVFASLYYCVNMYSAWICIWLYNYIILILVV